MTGPPSQVLGLPPSLPPSPSPFIASPNKRPEQTDQAAKWVSDARTILHSLDPSPFVTSSENRKSGMIGTIWHFTKQLLLWHNAESLEERPAVGGLHGKRLRAAEILLQKAAGSVKDADAIFLLAEMNFVCLHLLLFFLLSVFRYSCLSFFPSFFVFVSPRGVRLTEAAVWQLVPFTELQRCVQVVQEAGGPYGELDGTAYGGVHVCDWDWRRGAEGPRTGEGRRPVTSRSGL